MNRKNIYVTEATLPKFEEYISEIESIWETRWLTNMGNKHQELESNLKDYLNTPHIQLFTNGHMSIELSLKLLQTGGEVITTPFTFVSTIHAIINAGLKPVFCDVNEKDYTIDVTKIKKCITPNTVAILPVHVYGNICDVEKIQKVADKHSLKVIYDAAHAFGVRYKNKGIAEYGDISCFSFHATKVFNTIEGGCACFSNTAYNEILSNYKNFGITGPETVVAIGTNAKMNEFSAAMGLCNLKNICDNIEIRKKLVERYRKNLERVPGINYIDNQKDVVHNYSYFPIFIDESKCYYSRDELYEELIHNRVYSRKYFYPLITDLECYRNQYSSDETPVAKLASSRVLVLPLYPTLAIEDVDFICEIIKKEKENTDE